jgi:hypothetical protein
MRATGARLGAVGEGYQSRPVRRSVDSVLERLRNQWRKWRENRRQYQLERALYKAGGGQSRHMGGADGGGTLPQASAENLGGDGAAGT